MDIEEKKYLIYLLIIPAMILVHTIYYFWKKNKQKNFADHPLLEQLAPSVSLFKNGLKLVVLSLAVFCLVLALANPRVGTKVQTVNRQGIDIVFAIDVSKSMLAEDVSPSRIEKSKQIVSQLINNLASDRIGIIAYAASAFPALPITTDYSAAKMFLHQINTDMLSSQGTAISEAIQMATTYFDDPQTNKLLVLLTDGEDHEQGIEEAVAQAKEKGLKVLVIGVGTENGGPIPVKVAGDIQTYLRDMNNEVVITKLDESMLKQIANELSGSYISGGSTKKVTEHFKSILDTIERTEFESQEVAEYDSKFQWCLAIALFLLVLDIFFLEKRTEWIKRLNLFNEKKS